MKNHKNVGFCYQLFHQYRPWESGNYLTYRIGWKIIHIVHPEAECFRDDIKPNAQDFNRSMRETTDHEKKNVSDEYRKLFVVFLLLWDF